MYWKIIGYILAALLGLAVVVGVGVKLTQKAEGYKANNNQYFCSPEPHILFGCVSYQVYLDKLDKESKKIEAKK